MPFIRKSAEQDSMHSEFPKQENPAFDEIAPSADEAYGDAGYAPETSANEPEGAPVTDTSSQAVKKPSSNLPYIAGAAAMTVLFGGFMAYKFMGASGPNNPAYQQDVAVQMPAMAQAPALVAQQPLAPTPGALAHSPEVMVDASQPGFLSAQIGGDATGQLPTNLTGQSGAPAVTQSVLQGDVSSTASSPNGVVAGPPSSALSQPVAAAQQAHLAPTADAGQSKQAQDTLRISSANESDTSRILALETRLKASEEQYQTLHTQMSEVLAMLNTIAKAQSAEMAKLQAQAAAKNSAKTEKPNDQPRPVSKATDQPKTVSKATEKTRPTRVAQSAKPQSPKVEYKLFAIRTDRAWFRAPDGATIIVSTGENLSGVGLVKEVDVTAGAVVFANGMRIEIW